MTHTKEPWPVFSDIATTMTPDPEGTPVAILSWDDYIRARDCVNACANVPDSELVYGFPQLGNVAIVHTSFVDRFENTTKQRDDLQSQLKQVEALSEARLLQIGELKEQVECSNITEKNMEGRLNIATVKLASMTAERDALRVDQANRIVSMRNDDAVLISVTAQRDRLSDLCDTWNSECDDYRADNRDLSKQLAEAIKQRDELMAACEKARKCKAIHNMFPGQSRKSYGAILDDAIASAKGGAA